MFDLAGYSERGMVNALFYDVGAGRDSAEQLQRLASVLGLCRFLDAGGNLTRPFENAQFRHARVRVEQSFNDYGDLDALILLEEATSGRHAVFVEAKVNTAQGGAWAIKREWGEFLNLMSQGKSDSNLFIQLYQKLRLASHLRNPDMEILPASVPGGWDLGSHPVVERAWIELTDYCATPWYLALVPSGPTSTERFYRNGLFTFAPGPRGFNLPDWSSVGWGFLCWQELQEFCQADERAAGWPGLRRNFEYNDGQIYSTRPETEVQEPTRDGIETFLESLTENQRRLIHLLASAEGRRLSQRDLLAQLPHLAGDPRVLANLKASINKACERRGIDHILPPGHGDGTERIHQLSQVDLQLREWIVEIARAWHL